MPAGLRLRYGLKVPDPARGRLGASAAPYLIPLMAVLAAGILSRALSPANFEWLHGLRVLACAAAIGYFRRDYGGVDWRVTWLGPPAGIVAFVLCVELDHWSGPAPAYGGTPSALSGATPGLRQLWMTFRLLGAGLAIPVAEELAFRGFLLRRLVSAEFDALSSREFTWTGVAVSSLLYGAMFGSRWMAGTVAGLIYALVLVRRGRLGDAIAAHAVTNLLIAAYAILFQRWYLW